MRIKSYEDLDVYNRAYAIALEIHNFSLDLPKIEQYALAGQIRRASKSICANIAEGHAKQHRSSAEFKRFLSICAGSSEEMRVWLKFCRDLNYLDHEQWCKWDQEYDEISKMLNGLIKKWKD